MLEIAAKTGSVKIYESRIGNVKDINGRNSQGKTALILAAENGKYEIVRRLLIAGADYTCVDMFGMTAKDYLDKKLQKIVPTNQSTGLSYIPVNIGKLEEEPEVNMHDTDQHLLSLIGYMNNFIGKTKDIDMDPDLGKIDL